jgi:hypothetical protein
MGLREMIPGGRDAAVDEATLLREAMDYIVHLRAQVDVLRQVSEAVQRSSFIARQVRDKQTILVAFIMFTGDLLYLTITSYLLNWRAVTHAWSHCEQKEAELSMRVVFYWLFFPYGFRDFAKGKKTRPPCGHMYMMISHTPWLSGEEYIKILARSSERSYECEGSSAE